MNAWFFIVLLQLSWTRTSLSFQSCRPDLLKSRLQQREQEAYLRTQSPRSLDMVSDKMNDAIESNGFSPPHDKKVLTHLALLDQEICDLLALRRQDDEDSNRLLEALHQRLLNSPEIPPRAYEYERVIHAWSKEAARPQQQESSESVARRCQFLLQDAWVQFRAVTESTHNDEEVWQTYVPTRQMYQDTLRALSDACQANAEHAVQANQLLEEMQSFAAAGHVHLAPSTEIVNDVLQCWYQSKSSEGAEYGRCWLQRMVDSMDKNIDSKETETTNHALLPAFPPDTITFNTVMRCILQSGQPNATATECQALVDQMIQLDQKQKENGDDHSSSCCAPDLDSYTLLVQSYARAGNQHVGAKQAQAIVEGLEDAWRQGGTATVLPNARLYSIVLTAWSRSKYKKAANICRKILADMERLYYQDKTRQIPNTVSYNIILDALAKSGQKDAHQEALKVLQNMETLYQCHGRQDCQPDVVTYTSCIDAMAKNGDGEGAEELLNRLEEAYETSGHDKALQPNIRTYTSVIHAIARSRKEPQRAERLVSRMVEAYEKNQGVQPDVTCYNALLNAFGWADDYPSKAQKCNEVLQHMIQLYESGQNTEAKPDLITCNSVLNAAAFSNVTADASQRQEIMEIVVRTADTFLAGEYGQVNHVTFINLLLAIKRHMPKGPRRTALATTTFWQCCQTGNLAVPVVTALHQVLDWDDLKSHMGVALLSGPDEKLRFDLSRLPKAWTRLAPRPSERRESLPSRKSSNYRETRRVSIRASRV